MFLYHGSKELNLERLTVGSADKQGKGVYCTDSYEQALFYTEGYGRVYKLVLSDCKILDFSDEFLVRKLFSVFQSNTSMYDELVSLVNGSGVLLNVFAYASDKEKKELERILEEYDIYKIRSLGYRDHYNYIVKNSSLLRIV